MTQTDSFGSWDLYVSRFKSYMMVERQLATQTVSAYLSDVAHFLGFLKDQPIALETIRAFMTELSARGYEPTSISRKLSTLSLFCEFLRNEKVLSESIDCHYFLPKKGLSLPKALSHGEIVSLISTVVPTETYPHRNSAILELMYACGLRVSELVSITISCLDHLPFLKVLGKRSKERIIPVGDYADSRITTYLQQERHRLNKKDAPFLFLNARGTQLSRQSVNILLSSRATYLGFSQTVTPHMLRHSFATHLLDGNASIREVQQLLGHESLTTTQLYTHVNAAHLKRVIQEFHPRT